MVSMYSILDQCQYLGLGLSWPVQNILTQGAGKLYVIFTLTTWSWHNTSIVDPASSNIWK